MRILMLWSDLPNPYTGMGIPAFNLLKHLSQRHEITVALRKWWERADGLRHCLPKKLF